MSEGAGLSLPGRRLDIVTHFVTHFDYAEY
jgi:hypothetical protein